MEKPPEYWAGGDEKNILTASKTQKWSFRQLMTGQIMFSYISRTDAQRDELQNYLTENGIKTLVHKGKLIFDCPISTGLLLIGGDLDNMPIAKNPARIKIIGTLVLKGNCFINHSANVVVWKDGKMELGHGVRIASGCLVKAAKFVKIGDYTSLSSGCFLQDTNAHYIKDVETGEIKRCAYPIEIGKECWITMNVSILGGAKIPDRCIVARNSFLNKDYSIVCSPDSMLAGVPAKVVRENIQRALDIDKETMLEDFFRKNPDAECFIKFLLV